MKRDELIRQGVLIAAGSKSTREMIGRIIDMVVDECERRALECEFEDPGSIAHDIIALKAEVTPPSRPL